MQADRQKIVILITTPYTLHRGEVITAQNNATVYRVLYLLLLPFTDTHIQPFHGPLRYIATSKLSLSTHDTLSDAYILARNYKSKA